jgi:outer membrane protein assembly factor BamD (BamD/ComL family)
MMRARFLHTRRCFRMTMTGCAFAALTAAGFGASPAIKSARTTLNEGLPVIAAEKVRRILRQGSLDAEDRREAMRLLGEALLAAGQTENARTALAPLIKAGDSAARLLEAHSLVRDGEWEKARAAYGVLAAEPGAPLTAQIGEAECLRALGERNKALAILAPLLTDSTLPVEIRLRTASLYAEDQQLGRARQILSTTKVSDPADKLWAKYVDARILLAEQQTPAAFAQFKQILEATSNLSENLLAAATLGASEARVKLEGLEAADKELERFIWRNADSPWLELVFRRLDQVYLDEKSPSEDELRKWAVRQPARRAALARFYHARLQAHFGKWEKALGTLEPFARLYPEHRLLPFVHLLQADAFLEREQLTEAVNALDSASRSSTTDDQRAEIELRTGLVHFRQREFLLAANSFQQAAERSARIADIARYNAALAWLGQGNEERFAEEFARLGNRPETAVMRNVLQLEHGLTQAREYRPSAEKTLRQFLNTSPNHPRAEEARLALAEIAMEHGATEAASHLLKVANEKVHSEVNEDQAAYLAIFLADSKTPRDDSEIIKLGNAFLSDRKKSPLVPEIQMKLGQVYFRQSDYANAGTQFENLARDFPTSDYAEAALFLAGQCAMRSLNTGTLERGLRYFDQVVERDGPLKFHAREQQALIHVQMNKENQAVALYDLILEGRQSVDADLRASAMIGKSDALMSLGKSDPSKLDVALAVLEQLAGDVDAAARWRQRALYKKGKVLEALNRPLEMLEVYNEVLDQNLNGAAQDFFWFYQCGFESGRYFEQRQNWPAAIAIYEKVARLKGPRAEEAANRARRLRVEHFVWE